jgi:hypothetical protein
MRFALQRAQRASARSVATWVASHQTGAGKMSDDPRTIVHADLRRELKELREAIDGLRRRLDLIELSQPTA